jgi:hypothetical protein
MKVPISKSAAIAGAGVLLVGGVIVAAQIDKRQPGPAGEARHEQGAGSGGGRVKEPSRKRCPTEKAVEDPGLTVDPEAMKSRFKAPACMRLASREINGCIDADEEACKKRLQVRSRLIRAPGECLARPSELFCSVHESTSGHPLTVCFETKQECDGHHEEMRGKARICRIAPACARVALPPV